MIFIRNVVIFLLSFTLLNVVATAKETIPKGIIGMYHANDEKSQINALKQIHKLARKQGCDILRDGKIIDQQGSYSKMPVNQYFIMQCAKAVFYKNGIDAWTKKLKKYASDVILLEGSIAMLDNAAIESKGDQRGYIIKISQFNNLNPKLLRADFKKITAQVSKVSPRYRTEARVNIEKAYGMPRPDEVTVIYYNSFADGDAFRAENEHILEAISKFNNNHVEKFVYLIANSTR